MGENFSSHRIAFLMIGMVITGAANTLLFKLQDKQTVNGQPFNHPFLQTFTMFIGEIFCFSLFYLWKWRNPNEYQSNIIKAQNQGLKLNGASPWLLIPALSDFTTTTLQFFGLMLIDPSVYQMLRGGVIIVTALFSVIFLKKKITMNQNLGIFLSVIGITIVGISALLKKSDNLSFSENTLWGIVFVCLSLVTNGIIFVSEEKIFSVYHLEPLQVVGIEGCWGVVLCLLFLPILNFITLPQDSNMGIVSESKRYIERIDVYIEQIRNSEILMFSCIAALFSIAFFNFFGVSVTKNVSALARSLLDVTRTIFVWGIGLIIPNPNGGYWETFSLLQFCGFIVLISGTLIYNKIVMILPEIKEVNETSSKSTEEDESLIKEKNPNENIL